MNELFSNEVAGKNLKVSMLKLFNKMKAENYIPDFIRFADVATIYKGKGKSATWKMTGEYFWSLLLEVF